MRREIPILFNGAMVRAILAGRKTQTRRPVKPQPVGVAPDWHFDNYAHTADWCFWDRAGRVVNSIGPTSHTCMWRCPYGAPGDRLWVRETWAQAMDFGAATKEYHYRATYTNGGPFDDVDRWRPSIHMPRWACRLLLDVEAVRVERLHGITEADARAEGFESRAAFIAAFDAMYNLPHDANLWVWVVTFKQAKEEQK